MNTVTVEGSSFVLEFDYDRATIADVIKLPGRRAEPFAGTWTVPVTFAPAVLEFAAAHNLTLDSIAGGYTLEEPQDATVHYNGRDFEARFTYDKDLQAGIAEIAGSSWFQPGTCWLIPGDAGLAVNEWAEKSSARLTPEAEDKVEECSTIEERIELSGAKNSDYIIRDGFELELYDYQKAGVQYVIDVAGGRCIVGDEPGVGKTAVAMAVLHQLEALPAIIICPASLKINWRRELRRAMPHVSVEILRGTRSASRLLWADVTIINYDILPAWKDNLPKARGVVADESHKIRNPVIARTKATIEVMGRVPDDGVALCLTGTAVVNKTNEIMTQLRAIGQIHRFGGDAKARKKYHGKGVELNRAMRAICYIRRKKMYVWEEAPERNWAELIIEGDPHIMAEYRRAETNIVSYLAERAKKAAIESGATDEKARDTAWKAALKAEAGAHLVAISQLKQLSAKAKKPALIQWSKDFLGSGEKLGVFAWHRDAVDTMADALSAVKVQGGQSEGDRQKSVDLFQGSPQVRVICGQILAAGEGLTLTAASNALLMEQAWTPGAMDQVLDRFHRRGQVNDVVGWLALIEGTIDEDIRDLIAHKRIEVTETLDGHTLTEEEVSGSVLSDLVVRLAEKGMQGGNVLSSEQ